MTGWDALGWLCFGVSALVVATPFLIAGFLGLLWVVDRIVGWWRVW